MRIYDPRLGRFLSVDPLYQDFPWNSTYSFSENSPIANIDLDGAEKFPYKHPDKYPVLGKVNRYSTQAGNDASTYRIKDGNDSYLISKVTIYEQSKDAFGRVHHFNNYYFVQDKSLVNESDVSTGVGTTVKTKGTNWHLYLSDFKGMSSEFKVSNDAVNAFGTGVFIGAVALAAVPVIAAASPSLSSAATYLAPKPGFNPAGGAWDLINQKVFQGKSWNDVNWGTVGASSAFGGNLLSSSIWGATGSFTNLSTKNLSTGGNIFNFSQESVVSFGANVVGNVASGGTNNFIGGLNKGILKSPLERNIMNRILSVPVNAAGQLTTNQIEESSTPKK